MRWVVKKRRKLNSDGTEVGLVPKDRPRLPNLGDRRIKRKFLWFPRKIKNYWYWLEFCEFIYEWKIYYEYISTFNGVGRTLDLGGLKFKKEKEGWRLTTIITKQR